MNLRFGMGAVKSIE